MSCTVCVFVFKKLLFEDWWDGSPEAGDKTRPRTEYDEPKPQLQMVVIDREKATSFCCKVKVLGVAVKLTIDLILMIRSKVASSSP